MTRTNHLTHIHTSLGVRTVGNSVAYCNRCGLCACVCPAYAILPQESSSPRGRNQSLRLVLEGKLPLRRYRKELEPLVRTCSLCGKCTQACPGNVPTPEHMLELRRMLGLAVLPKTLRALLRLRATSPKLFQAGLHTARWLHHMGLLHWGTILPGFGWIKHACEILPTSFQKPFCPVEYAKPNLIYLPSLEAEFLQPALATRVYQTACKKYRVTVWKNTSSGLFEYLYGDLRQARKQLRCLIVRHQQSGGKPLLTDSFDVYQFLKKAPQLFEGFSLWEERASQFAKQIRFVTDLWPKTMKKTSFPGPVYWMPSVLFDAGQTSLTHTAEILHTLFKKNFVQCGYKDAAVAPAAYGFVYPQQAQKQALRAVAFLAAHQTQTVFVPSGLVALELEAQLRRFYPTAHAYHLAELDG